MTEKRRLVADRFRRVWAVVEEIAANPGQSRRQLADRFFLSERQLQSDLNLLRTDMRLPLIRRQGYRFADECGHGGASMLTLADAQALVLTLAQALRTGSMPRDHARNLLGKLPTVCPPHVAPLVSELVRFVTRTGATCGEDHPLTVLADCAMRGLSAELRIRPAYEGQAGEQLTVVPELVIPYLSQWFVLAQDASGKRARSRMIALDRLAAVTVVQPDVAASRRAS